MLPYMGDCNGKSNRQITKSPELNKTFLKMFASFLFHNPSSQLDWFYSRLRHVAMLSCESDLALVGMVTRFKLSLNDTVYLIVISVS